MEKTVLAGVGYLAAIVITVIYSGSFLPDLMIFIYGIFDSVNVCICICISEISCRSGDGSIFWILLCSGHAFLCISDPLRWREGYILPFLYFYVRGDAIPVHIASEC